MKSSTVSKIISNIQFTLYSFFTFIISGIIIFYALLTNGVSMPLVILPGLKVEQLYIKLDKKLILHADRIYVSYRNNKPTETPLENIPELLSLVDFTRNNFHSFKVEELNIGDKKVTFSYTKEPTSPEDNTLTLQNEEMNLTTSFSFHDSFMLAKMENVLHKPTNITLNSKLIIDFNTRDTYSITSLSLPEKTNLNIYTKTNTKALAFSASSNAFRDLSAIINIFNLKKNISKWIVDYNRAQSYQLLEAKGVYAYKNPQVLVNTLFLHARETGLNYTFHPKLFPVSSPSTDVYFEKGVLSIRPHHAMYNLHLLDERSAVNIDFNQQHTLLNVDLRTQSVLDSDIIEIVNAYNIPLPLLQEKGTTQAHIDLTIDLFNEEVSANGEFFVRESDLILDGIRYKIKNATARLHKGLLSLDSTSVNYDDIFLAIVNGQLDLRTRTGDFFFDVESIKLPLSQSQELELLDKNVQVQLNFDKESQKFIFPTSHWKFDEYTMTLGRNSLIAPVKFDSRNIIKDLKINIPNITDIKINGVLDLARASTKLDLNLSNINYHQDDLNLSSAQVIPLELHYDNNKTDINLHQPVLFQVNDNTLEILPTKVQVKNGYLETNTTEIRINEELFTQLSTHYKVGEKKIELLLQNTMLSSPELLFIEPVVGLSYEKSDGKHHFDIDKLTIHAVLNEDKSLQLNVKDFSKLHPYSSILRMYDIKAGSADFIYIDKDNIGVDLRLVDFPPLLSKNGKKITSYDVKGRYKDEVTQLSINNDIDFIYYKKGKFIAKNVDFNLFAIKEYLNDIQNKNEKNNLELLVQTNNCNVRLGDSGRKILSDTIKINIKKDTIDAQLFHGKGVVLFQSEGDTVSVYGQNLNDAFINELFKFSTFKNGTLSFAVTGTYDNFKGIVQIDDTILKDYTVLNNTLAFFNTIPSLVTFSVPGYSKKGLKVDKMYTNFDVNGSNVSIKDTKISSKELTITARGKSDLQKETIDLLMQVKTDLGSSAKNIPVIGYIIFGDDSISTTVRVHGDLKDPKVESSVAKSVIVAPYNIIKRTITLPFKALDIFDKNDSKPNE